MMYFGTSGFSYNDWVGSFYPLGMPKREWLIYYAHEFDTCEVNSTFYALPKPSSLKAMTEKTGEGFLFSIKANQEMTHQQEDNAAVCKAFCQVLEPVIAAGKIDSIAEKTFIFANNHWRGQSISTIRQLRLTLD